MLITSQSRVLCCEEQLLLTFSDEGSRQLKLFWASLTLQGPEWIDPTFSRSRIKRRDQREKVAISNRLPRFRIRAHFAPIPLLDSRKPQSANHSLVCCCGAQLKPVFGIYRSTSAFELDPTSKAADKWDIDCTGLLLTSSSGISDSPPGCRWQRRLRFR